MAILVMTVTGLFAFLNARNGSLWVAVLFSLPALAALVYLLMRRKVQVARTGRKVLVSHSVIGVPLGTKEYVLRDDASMTLGKQRLDHRASLSSTTWWHLNFLAKDTGGKEQLLFFLSEHTPDNRQKLADIAVTVSERFGVPLKDER